MLVYKLTISYIKNVKFGSKFLGIVFKKSQSSLVQDFSLGTKGVKILLQERT